MGPRCRMKMLPSITMRLALMFQQHVCSADWFAFSAHPNLDEALQRLYAEGQAAWPQIQLAPEQVVVFLARQLPPEVAEPAVMATLRARELFLLCAFALGHRTAQTIITQEYLPAVRLALQKLGTSDAMIADIQQDLCGRLIERQDPQVVRRGYAGRGELAGWLRTAAVREALLRHKRGRKECALDAAAEARLPDQHQSPHGALFTGHLKEAFQTALRQAVAALSSRERNLLRYHFVLRLNIDQIGSIYQIHRTTAGRWVARAQDRLIAETRQRFSVLAEVSEESMPNMMQQLQSHLSLNLGSVLKTIAES